MAAEWPKMMSSEGRSGGLTVAFACAVTAILGIPTANSSPDGTDMSTRITTNVLNGMEEVGRILES
jgi:hypothetical protein